MIKSSVVSNWLTYCLEKKGMNRCLPIKTRTTQKAVNNKFIF